MGSEASWPEPVTILSDLHIGHALSLVRHPRELRPLLDAGGTLLLNGDTFEQRLPGQAKRAAELAEELSSEAAAAGCKAVLIAGNHDPHISERRMARLCGGAVLVTHGHALFQGVTPWSDRAGEMARRCAELEAVEGLEGDPLAGLSGLGRRLAIAHIVSLQADIDDIPREGSLWGRLGRYLSQFAHPGRPIKVLQCWADTPRLAGEFAERFDPEARFVVIGHTHLPGEWRVGKRVVVNTGSFALPLWRSAVQVSGGRLGVFKVKRRGGVFRLGRERRSFEVPDSCRAH